MMRKLKFSKKLATGILIISLTWMIAFISLYSVYLNNERKAAIEKEKEVITNMSKIISVQTDDYFESIHMFLITADLWLASHPEVDPRFDKEFVALVDAFRSSTKDKIDIRLVTEAGGLFYIPSESTTPLADVRDRLYFTSQSVASSRGFFISDPVKSRVTNLWGIPISYPLKSKNFGVSVIFAAIEIQNLENLFLPLRSDVNETIILVRKDGKTLALTPFNDEVLGKDLVNWAWWENKFSAEPSGIILNKSDDDKKVTSMASYNILEDLPLVVIVVADMASTLEPWYDSLLPRVVIILTVILFVVFITIIMLRLISKLDVAMDEISKLSITDSLTGLYNRRKGQEFFDQELYRSDRYHTQFSVIMMDIDYFKNINDAYGHNIGDQILISLSQLIKQNIRQSDAVCRWGGEEFVIFCPDTTQDQAFMLAEKLRLIIGTTFFEACQHLTCSFGISTYVTGDTSETLINRADEALYLSKNAGRNTVSVK